MGQPSSCDPGQAVWCWAGNTRAQLFAANERRSSTAGFHGHRAQARPDFRLGCVSGRRQLVVMRRCPTGRAFSHMAEACQFWPDPAPHRLAGPGIVRGCRIQPVHIGEAAQLIARFATAITAPRVCRLSPKRKLIGGQLVSFSWATIGHHPQLSKLLQGAAGVLIAAPGGPRSPRVSSTWAPSPWRAKAAS